MLIVVNRPTQARGRQSYQRGLPLNDDPVGMSGAVLLKVVVRGPAPVRGPSGRDIRKFEKHWSSRVQMLHKAVDLSDNAVALP
jgi:hypothetical protein